MPIYTNALAQRPANMLAYQDTLSATPRNEYLGALADLIAQSYSPERTQQMQGVAKFLSAPAISQTLDRLSYGEPLTTGAGGLGGTTRVRPEALEAAMAVAPAAKPVTMASLQAAREARRAALGIGMAGERYAEKVVPEILNRGGLPAEILQGMATNTTSKMFIGPGSPAFDRQMALKASQMAKKGSTPQEIWKTTGSVKGPDGAWRQEISDVKAEYDPESLADLKFTFEDKFNYLKHTQPLGGTLEHPELYKAYPELSDMPVHFMPAEKMKGAYGAYSPKKDRMTLSDQLTPEQARSSSLHEVQHAIQEREGFAVGGNARDFAKIKYEANSKIDELNNELRNIVKQMDEPNVGQQQKNALRDTYENLMEQRQSLVPAAQIDPTQAYGHLMGEAEARLTQRRMNLTPEQRIQNFPFEYTGETGYGLDVRPEKMINMTSEGVILKPGLLGQNFMPVNSTPNQLGVRMNNTSYRGSHTAPGPDFGAPLHDLTGGGQMYPADVYSAKAAQYYGTGFPKADREAFALANRVRGNPDAEVTMYRAVPKDDKITSINAGDWVTLSKDYAKVHGESVLDNNYKILSQKVKAKDLWTNADSIHEFGYQPQTQNP